MSFKFRLLDNEDDQQLQDDADQMHVLQSLVGDDVPPTSRDTTSPALQASATDPQVADFRSRLAQAQSARASNMDDDTSALEELVRQHSNRSHTAGDIDTVLAMGLDLFANRGRGLGQITGAYVSNRDAESRDEDALKKDLAMAQAHKKASSDPVAELLRQQAVENALAGHETTAEREARLAQQAKLAEAHKTPGTDQYAGDVQKVEDTSGARVSGRENKRTEMLPQIEQTESGISGAKSAASTRATTDELRDNPRDLTRQQRELLDREDKRIALEEQAHADAVAAREATLANTQEHQRQGEMTEFRNKNLDLLKAAKAARELHASIEQHPDDVPGLGPLDRLVGMFGGGGPEGIANKQAFAAITNPEILKVAGKAVTGSAFGGEQSRANAATGTSPFASEAEQIAAVNTIKANLESALRAAGLGRTEIARRIASEYGLDDLYPADEAPASARDAMPQVRDSGAADLGTTKQTKRGAKNADFAGPGVERKVKLKLPSRRVINASLTEEQLAAALAGGAELQ